MRCLPLGPFLLLGLATLAGCTVAPPQGPTVMASPGPGKSFGQFRTDDLNCRAYANNANGGVTPGQGATTSGVGTALAGTAIGAAAGALLGAAGHNAGAGAAIGAGGGLLVGSALGSENAARSAGSLQANYDRVYAQCMAAAGENVAPPPVAAYPGPGAPPPPPVVVVPPPYYGPYYGYYGYRRPWGW